MTPEVLARVTEPFFTTKPAGKGTGLDLAMAQTFSEQSGGGMRIDSASGQGTTIKLWLPLAGGEAVPRDLHQSPDDASVTGKRAGVRILLADDDPIVRGVIAKQLENAGYAVLSAGDGPEALAALDAGEAVDLIIADLSMPDMDGIACIREVHQRQRELPAILMTGFAINPVEMTIQGALTSNLTLLRKPISASYLIEQIDSLLIDSERNSDISKPG